MDSFGLLLQTVPTVSEFDYNRKSEKRTDWKTSKESIMTVDVFSKVDKSFLHWLIKIYKW